MICPTLALKRVTLAVLLLTGCTSTRGLAPGQDPRLAYFQRENQKIDERENRCIGEVLASSKQGIPPIATASGDSKDQQAEQVARGRAKGLDACRTNAAREREELSERERANYQDNAQEERDRKSLMMTLTSGPH